MNIQDVIHNITKPTFAGRSMIRRQYTCSIHSMINTDQPGSCPECGIDLIPAEKKRQGSHGDQHVLINDVRSNNTSTTGRSNAEHAHHDEMSEDFKKRFYIVAALALPVVALSPVTQDWLTVNWSFPGSEFMLFILSSIIFFYGGSPFFTGSLHEVKSKSPGIMTLVAVAITLSYVYSVAIMVGSKDADFFWQLALLIPTTLLGHWAMMTYVKDSSREWESLVELMPINAHLLRGGLVVDVQADSLKFGDVILVRAGEKVTADGEIVHGQSKVNESMLTGDSNPVEKHMGDRVIAGTINGEGDLKVIVTHEPKDFYLSQLIKHAHDAQRSKSRTRILADNTARWFTIIALALAIVTFAVWLVMGKDLAFASERMITVLIICCPHAVALAVPLVVAYSTSIAVKSGLLIKERTAFEKSRKISTILFNKTGTLTEGKVCVVGYDSLISTYTSDEILSVAAAVEVHSGHPIASAIIRKAKQLNLQVSKAKDFRTLPGKGVQAFVDGKKVSVVSPEFLKENKLHTDSVTSKAETTVYIVVERRVAGFVSLTDELRPESREAIQLLHNHKIKTLLLTGDNKYVAQKVSEASDMTGFVAEVLPHQKLEKIRELQAKGEFLAMTGSGLSDAPGLAEANVGIAVGWDPDGAADTADIVLLNNNPRHIVNVILFGRATYQKIVENLAWAIGYNILALPIAAGILYNQGVLLSPAAGAVLTGLSTIVIALNAQKLRTHQQGEDSTIIDPASTSAQANQTRPPA